MGSFSGGRRISGFGGGRYRKVATPSGGGIPVRGLRGERAARLWGVAIAPRDVSIPKPQRPADRVADEDAGDRHGAGAVRVSEDSGAAAARRLAGGQDEGKSALSGRGLGAATDGPEETACGSGTTGAAQGDRAESGVESGLCGGSIGGRKKISSVDGDGCAHPRKSGYRAGTELEGARRGAGAAGASEGSGWAEAAVL